MIRNKGGPVVFLGAGLTVIESTILSDPGMTFFGRAWSRSSHRTWWREPLLGGDGGDAEGPGAVPQATVVGNYAFQFVTEFQGCGQMQRVKATEHHRVQHDRPLAHRSREP